MAKTDTRMRIADILADGEFHSGQVIGEALGISRAAVANHVKLLSEMGLDIYSVQGKGYKLANHLDLLNQTLIQQNCKTQTPLDVLTIVDSTNTYLMNRIREQQNLADGYSVVAECQTAGRGRRGRVWQSPFGSHVYLSQYRIMEDGLAAASAMSLAIGIAVVRACNKFVTKNIGLKWPNDVLCEGKKLAGILVEAEGQSDGACHLIIGVGVNVAMPEADAKAIDQPWIDLSSLSDEDFNRNVFIAELLDQIDAVVAQYRVDRLDTLVNEWNNLNAFDQKNVRIITAQNEKLGLCLGIDNSGALLLQNPVDGTIQKLFGGELSLRGVE